MHPQEKQEKGVSPSQDGGAGGGGVQGPEDRSSMDRCFLLSLDKLTKMLSYCGLACHPNSYQLGTSSFSILDAPG